MTLRIIAFAALLGIAIHAHPLYIALGAVVEVTQADPESRKRLLEQLPEAPGSLVSPLPDYLTGNETKQAADPVTARSRAVTIDQDYLRALVAAESVERDASGAIKGSPQSFRLKLFDDVEVRIVKTSTRVDRQGFTLWRGEIIEDPEGSVAFAIKDGAISGAIKYLGREFRIQQAADGAYRIVETDPQAVPHGNDVVHPPAITNGPIPSLPRFEKPQALIDSSRVEKTAAGKTVVTAFVAYTNKALASRPNIVADIALAADTLNAALARSLIDIEVQVAQTALVTYTEPTNNAAETILNNARDEVGDFARIATLKRAVKADILSVIADFVDPTAEGIGTLTDTANIDYQAQTSVANVVRVRSLVGNTFNHEFGHNFGASHDRYVEPNAKPGPQEYAFGYVDVEGGFRDIMAYSDKCDAVHKDCPDIDYFSNPNLTYKGRAIGVPYNQAEAADVARKLNENASALAQLGDLYGAPRYYGVVVGKPAHGTISGSNYDNLPAVKCGSGGSVCSTAAIKNDVIALDQAADTGYSFDSWVGDCSPQYSNCAVTVDGLKSISAIFSKSGEKGLGIAVAGQGAVKGTGVDCSVTCGTSMTTGTTVALTATPALGWKFKSWSGACSGTTNTCSVTLSATRLVTATFIESGPAQVAAIAGVIDRQTGGVLNSYFRLFNGGSAQADFSVTVLSASGQTLGTTTLQVPPNAAKQYQMKAILDLVAPGTAAGGTYSVYLSSSESTAGYQHVIFNGFTSLYENASACKNLLSQTSSLALIDVHTSVIEAFGFPMQVLVHNYANTAKTYIAKIYEGSTGTLRGQINIPLGANASRSLGFVSEMQTVPGVNWTPTSEGFANVVITDSTGGAPNATVASSIDTSGKLGIGASTNMSIVCAVNAPSASTTSGSVAVTGVVDRQAGGVLNSYFRLYNGGTAQANFSVTVLNTSGQTIGTTTLQIPPNAAKQYQMQAILDLAAPGTAGGGTYSVYLSSPESAAGYQHVVFNGVTSLYENASACKNLLSQTSSLALIDVHTSVIEAFGFPMQVLVHNYANTAKTYIAKVYEGSTGTLRGQVSIPLEANASRSLAFVGEMQKAAGVNWTPTSEGFANVVITDSTGGAPSAMVASSIDTSGKLGVGASTNMSIVCAVNAGSP